MMMAGLENIKDGRAVDELSPCCFAASLVAGFSAQIS